jgi:Xaa-Pro aminopeptidase
VVYASGEELFKNTVKRQASLYVRPPVDIEAMQQDSLNISPIKDIIKEPIKWSDYLIYVYIIGALATLALLYFFYQRYRSGDLDKVDVVEEVYVPAHRKALDKLYGLNEKQLWQSGKIKEYQTELTDIVREYLENRYQVRALESTTDEIIYDLKRQNLTSDQITELRNILQVADLVKFAKSKPDISIHQEFMDKSVDFVQSTKEKPLVEEV